VPVTAYRYLVESWKKDIEAGKRKETSKEKI
jgi:hypothetical protein